MRRAPDVAAVIDLGVDHLELLTDRIRHVFGHKIDRLGKRVACLQGTAHHIQRVGQLLVK